MIARCAIASACSVIALTVTSLTAAGQPAATIAGRVLDETGGVLPGVTVHLHAASTELTVITDATGTYRFEMVPPGAVELAYRLINFTLVHRTLTVGQGHTAIADTVLRLALSADVVVTAAATFRNIIDVENPEENLVGIASAASQGAVTAPQVAARPLMRAGQVFETVPGMIVSQHSGEGKANQYYLRGFNLDHGTDLATTVAGVPVNMPTGAHSHGYADANWLIPELVSGVQFKKGPYFADEGDFSAAGAVSINYVNVLDRPIAQLSGGSDRWGRVVAAASPRIADGYLLGAVELNHYDGPWDLEDNSRRVNGVLRYSRGNTRDGFSMTGMAYWADWNSTDHVPARALSSGLISRFGNIDPTDKGHAERQSLAVELQRAGSNTSTRATAYLLHNELQLFSNFTYFLDDPEGGDQFEQSERRVAAGGRLSHRRLGHVFDRHTESGIGLQVRRDWIDPIGLYRTSARRRTTTTREDTVGQTMLGLYAQSDIEWARAFRTILGVRADVYQLDVTSQLPVNSGAGSHALASPKVTAIVGPWGGTELYGNFGMGYHSNDARGTVISVDPATGAPVQPVTPLVRATGAEFGVRTVRVRGLQSTLALWYLDLDSELVFAGDAGTTVAGRPSRRAGVEWVNYARLRPWLTADLDVSLTSAHFTDDDPAGTRIPGALNRVISAGLTVEPERRISGSLRVRHFGPRPLIENGSATSKSTTLWNGEVGFRMSQRLRLVLEGFNLLDSDASDIDYFYTSRLRGEPLAGVDDIHTHPTLPRSARLALHVGF